MPPRRRRPSSELKPGQTHRGRGRHPSASSPNRPTTWPWWWPRRSAAVSSNSPRMMTAKARALGMMHTNYHNASGLPDDRQITTARDQAILGARASRTASRNISTIFPPGASSIAARRCATTTTCSAESPASTASRPAISASPASTSSPRVHRNQPPSRGGGVRRTHRRCARRARAQPDRQQHRVASAKRTAPLVVEGWQARRPRSPGRRLCRRRHRQHSRFHRADQAQSGQDRRWCSPPRCTPPR